MCHGANKIQKKKLETSGFRKSEFRIQNSEFRKLIWETGFQNRETGILKVGNWTGKLQNSDTGIQNSEFRIQEFRTQNSETGPGNYSSESRKLDRETSGFRIGKLDRETSEFRKSEFRIQETSELRIQETSESGNWTGKLQNSRNLRIQKLQNSGNWMLLGML